MSPRRTPLASLVLLLPLLSLALPRSAASPAAEAKRSYAHDAPVALTDLPGGALHIRAGDDVLMVPATSAASRSRRQSSPSTFLQYYVRTTTPVPSGFYNALLVAAKEHKVEYIPEGTFLTMLDSEGFSQVEAMSGVLSILHADPAHKIDHRPGHSRRTATHNNATAYPNATLDIQVVSGPEVASTIATWASLLTSILGERPDVRHPSPTKAVVETASHLADAAADWLALQEITTFVEQREAMMPRNKYARGLVENFDQDGTNPGFLWAKGLKGQGQVVGVGDTGLDADSCFFRDDNVALPSCQLSQYGQVAPASCINQNHRKVVSYRAYPRGDIGDNFQGHGTHVAGSIAGAAAFDTSSKVAWAADYNGLAMEAKLAVDDISADGNSLWPGDDLSTELFPHAALAQAHLHSNSWGGYSNEYTSYAREMDQYTHDNNNDFLILVAAGNDGPDANTVGEPATAKNILSVGAGGHSVPAYNDYGISTGSGQVVCLDADAKWLRHKHPPTQARALESETPTLTPTMCRR